MGKSRRGVKRSNEKGKESEFEGDCCGDLGTASEWRKMVAGAEDLNGCVRQI
jgi:hypothetical protein